MEDSVATSIHLLPTSTNENNRPPSRLITVRTEGGYTLTNLNECNILVKYIPKESRTAHIFTGLQRHSLIFIAELFDTGCKVLFTNQEVIVTKNDQVVWK